MTMRILLLVSVLLAALGCNSAAPQEQAVLGPRAFGERCERTEDCASGVCVRVDAGGGICSRTCVDGAECPTSDNWRCLDPGSLGGARVCACRPLALEEVCGNGIDDDCNGKVDDCQTCAGKPIPRDDRDNCGSCGNACRSDQICSDGRCTCSGASERECSGRCTDVARDPIHCGACQTTCPSGQSCVAGACKCPDPTKQDVCAGIGCVDLQTDGSSCGTCGKACLDGQTCEAGTCRCPAATPDVCGATCVDLKTAETDCGSCGKVCATGTQCRDGACVCPSTTAPDYCAGTGCVDKNRNTLHCGACGNACPTGTTCQSGVCACPSSAYPDICGSTCVDKRSDPKHCGACGNVCGGGQSCVDGTCACPAGQTACGLGCFSTNADPYHCGDCLTRCPSGTLCIAGVCTCSSGLTLCDSGCVNPVFDPRNCGECGKTCRVGERCASGTCTCDSGLFCGDQCVPLNDNANCGACGVACGAGQYCNAGKCVCSSSSLTACGTACIDLKWSSANCGECGKACTNGMTCYQGSCGCHGDTWQCGDKCEYLRTDVNNCGECGKKCRNTEVCGSGTCYCPSGDRFCASTGACTQTVTNNAHCGACDAACPTATSCTGSVCKCDDTTKTLCDGACVDVKTDEANCGGCGKTCSGTLTCKAGACKCENPLVSTHVRITNADNESSHPHFAYNGTNVAAVFTDKRLGNLPNAYFTLLAADGTRALANDLALTAFPNGITGGSVTSRPRVVWTGTRWVMVWAEAADDGTGKTVNRARVRGITAAGVPDDLDLKLPMIGGAAGATIAYHPTFGCAIVYTAAYDRLYFQKLGAACDAPATATMIAPGYGGYDSEPQLVISPTGEYGVLSQAQTQNVSFIRFNADGSRTKDIVVLSELSYDFTWPTLAHDGTTWVAVLVAEKAFVPRSLVVARGEDLSARTTLIADVANATERLHRARFVLDGDILELLFTRRSSSGVKLHFTRFRLPSALASPAAQLTDPVDVVSTNNVGPEHGMSLTAVGTTLLAGWSDNRWGPYELYDALLDRRACP